MALIAKLSRTKIAHIITLDVFISAMTTFRVCFTDTRATRFTKTFSDQQYAFYFAHFTTLISKSLGLTSRGNDLSKEFIYTKKVIIVQIIRGTKLKPGVTKQANAGIKTNGIAKRWRKQIIL
jgi:hypothetical protein